MWRGDAESVARGDRGDDGRGLGKESLKCSPATAADGRGYTLNALASCFSP